jgi:hypothetical protein
MKSTKKTRHSKKPKTVRKAAASHETSKPSQSTLYEVLQKYALALRSEPKALSFERQVPELQIKLAFQKLFPDTRISGRRDWFCMNPLSIRRAYKELVNSKESEPMAKAFELLREIVLPCYRTMCLGWIDARLLADGEDLGEEFQGLVLTQQQTQSLTTTLPDIQQAMQGIMYMADMWPADLQDAHSRDYFGWCLRTMAQVLKGRAAKTIKSLDVALGFSGSGRGNRSDREKADSKNAWNDNCFDIHLLHLSGEAIPTACRGYVDGQDAAIKSQSPEVFEKMYQRWRNDPITRIRLHLGDPLAKRILSLPDVQQLVKQRFYLSSQ